MSDFASQVDMMIKDLSTFEIDKCVQMIGANFGDGRVDIATKVKTHKDTVGTDSPGKIDPVCEIITRSLED